MGNKFISGAVHGDKKTRRSGIRFKLLPQAQDVIVNRACRRIVFIAPHFVEQFMARNNAFRRGRQILEQIELLGCENDGLARATGLHARKIYACITEGKDFVRVWLDLYLSHR